MALSTAPICVCDFCDHTPDHGEAAASATGERRSTQLVEAIYAAAVLAAGLLLLASAV